MEILFYFIFYFNMITYESLFCHLKLNSHMLLVFFQVIVVLCFFSLPWSCVPHGHHNFGVPHNYCGLGVPLITTILYFTILLIMFVFYFAWDSFTLLVLDAFNLIIKDQQPCYLTSLHLPPHPCLLSSLLLNHFVHMRFMPLCVCKSTCKLAWKFLWNLSLTFTITNCNKLCSNMFF